MQMMMYCIGGEWWYDHHHEEDDNDEVCDDDADDDCDEGFPVLAVVSYHREHYLISTIWILFEYWIIRSPLIVMKVSQCWQWSGATESTWCLSLRWAAHCVQWILCRVHSAKCILCAGFSAQWATVPNNIQHDTVVHTAVHYSAQGQGKQMFQNVGNYQYLKNF